MEKTENMELSKEEAKLLSALREGRKEYEKVYRLHTEAYDRLHKAVAEKDDSEYHEDQTLEVIDVEQEIRLLDQAEKDNAERLRWYLWDYFTQVGPYGVVHYEEKE